MVEPFVYGMLTAAKGRIKPGDVALVTKAGPIGIMCALEAVSPAGCVAWVGMPVTPVPFDLVLAQWEEIRMETVFRYANVYDRAIALIGSGREDLRRLILLAFPHEASVQTFDRAVEGRPKDVKIQIKVARTQGAY